MAERILAQGHKWQITHELRDHRVWLSLVSEYGTVELVSKDLRMLEMFESIEREYNKLREQGPIVVESEARNA